ncbi:unnamed protein product [Chrysoparadoxa australica]
MSEFGAVRCSADGCIILDFLPFQCQACGLTYCLEHRSFTAHNCAKAEEYLRVHRAADEADLAYRAAVAAPITSEQSQGTGSNSMKPSEMMAAVKARFQGPEHKLNDMAHFRVKGSSSNVSSGPDQAILKAAGAVARAKTEKDVRVGSQVHRMLVKSRAVGDKRLPEAARFFLEVRYDGNEKAVHHHFFSAQRTAGRVLDELVGLHGDCLSSACKAGAELVCSRTGLALPLAMSLRDLEAESQLQNMDSVVVAPANAYPAPPSQVKDPTPQPTAPFDEDLKGDQGEEAPQVEQEKVEGQIIAGTGPISITIAWGKHATFTVKGIEEALSVLELKRMLEGVTGVPFNRQKLMYKGMLKDDSKLSDTKIRDGVKVTLMGTKM